MEEQRFDTIVQRFALAAPRRTAVQGVGGALALLAALALPGSALADRHGDGDGKANNGGRGGNGKKKKKDGDKKRERQRDRQRNRSSANSSATGGAGATVGTGATGPTGVTGPAGPDEETSEDVIAEKKKAKPIVLDSLADVAIVAPPSDGQLLVYFAGATGGARWQNLHEVRLENLYLTSQVLSVLRSNAASLTHKLDLSLADLDTAVTRTQTFPDANGVFVLDTAAQLLTNKTVNDDSFVIQDDDAPTAKARFNAQFIPLNTTRVYDFPDVSGTLTVDTNVQTLTNKTVVDDSFTIQDNADATRQARFDAGNIASATTRTYTLPDADGTLALASGTGFTVTEIEGTLTEVNGGPVDLSATCPNGKAVGIGFSASGPVDLRGMRFIADREVRVTVATTAATNVRAVARCMTMP